jgi:hypothetical protein
MSLISYKIFGWIRSGPGEVCVFNLFNLDNTVSSENISSSIELHGIIWVRLFTAWIGTLAHTLIKYSLNAFALSKSFSRIVLSPNKSLTTILPIDLTVLDFELINCQNFFGFFLQEWAILLW